MYWLGLFVVLVAVAVSVWIGAVAVFIVVQTLFRQTNWLVRLAVAGFAVSCVSIAVLGAARTWIMWRAGLMWMNTAATAQPASAVRMLRLASWAGIGAIGFLLLLVVSAWLGLFA